MPEITIKKGSANLVVDRKDLIDVSETYDGIVFNFSRGFQVYQVDESMPTHAKQIICNTCNRFTKGKLKINLDDYEKPISVDLT